MNSTIFEKIQYVLLELINKKDDILSMDFKEASHCIEDIVVSQFDLTKVQSAIVVARLILLIAPSDEEDEDIEN